MPAWTCAAGVGGFTLGVSITLAVMNLIDGVVNERQAVAATVNGRPILSSEVDQEAGTEICAAVQEARAHWLESREYLIARRLIEDEATQTGRSVQELLRVEVAENVTPIPESQVMELAVSRAGGRPPTPDLMESARHELEARELQRVRERYLSALAGKSTVERSGSVILDTPRVLAACGAGHTGPKDDAPAMPPVDRNLRSQTIYAVMLLALTY